MSLLQLRPYQQEAIDAVRDYWAGGGGNPLVDLATGLGKSVVIGKLTKDLVTEYPDLRFLMLVHVRELVAQNYQALVRLWPNAPAGIYSAGLGKRDTHHRITFASIQSVFRKARELGPRDVVLIDEAHLVPNEGDGMYRALLEGLADLRPDMRVAGFSATPYRMGTGRLDQGDNRLFDQVVYSYGVRKGIEDGWLSPLVSKPGKVEIDVSGVAKRGGEFVAGALEAAADDDAVTRAAVAEVAQLGADRRSWLMFCTGVKHAYHVRDAVRSLGISCETVTGDTPAGDRDRIIREFKAGRIRCLTNANVLTTGFDAPAVDLLVLLRPTLSTGLYVQMIGRGTRLADGKANCMVLDYAGVVRRHGPVDTVEVGGRKARGQKDDAAVTVDSVRAKECPNCNSMAALSARSCGICGHEWPVDETPKHAAEADDVPILSTGQLSTVEEMPVVSWSAKPWVKDGAPDTLRVQYLAGLVTASEWVCFEHQGYPRRKAERWWAEHGGAAPCPETVEEAVVRWGEVAQPAIIQTRRNGKWFDVVGRRFATREEAAA